MVRCGCLSVAVAFALVATVACAVEFLTAVALVLAVLGDPEALAGLQGQSQTAHSQPLD